MAVAEADLRQPRALAHQHRKGARRYLRIERAVIAGFDAVEAAQLVGDHAGEHVEPSGRAFRIGGGGNLVGQRQAFQQRHDIDAAGFQHRAVARARPRAASIRRCAWRPWCGPARSSRARGRQLRPRRRSRLAGWIWSGAKSVAGRIPPSAASAAIMRSGRMPLSSGAKESGTNDLGLSPHPEERTVSVRVSKDEATSPFERPLRGLLRCAERKRAPQDEAPERAI